MIIDFSDNEKKMLSGLGSKLAAKHGCTKKYVCDIINGKSKFTTELSIMIYKDLRWLIEFFEN